MPIMTILLPTSALVSWARFSDARRSPSSDEHRVAAQLARLDVELDVVRANSVWYSGSAIRLEHLERCPSWGGSRRPVRLSSISIPVIGRSNSNWL
jgi:hypothetical protein